MKNTKLFSMALVILITIVLILIAVGIIAIASLPEPTPKATLTATPTVSPSHMPTATPTPTPAPTTIEEYEAERAKLGIVDEKKMIKAIHIDLILFKTSESEYKMALVLPLIFPTINKAIFYDIFTGEPLFEFDSLMVEDIFNEGSTETVVPVNESLKNAIFLRDSSPMNQFFDFPKLGIELPLSDEFSEYYSLISENFLSKTEYAELYFRYIPQEFRMYGEELIPSSPDVLLSNYSGPAVTISPN